MRRLQFALLAAVAAIGFASSASAADMPVKAPVYKAPVAVAFSWTGFYLGAQGGYSWDGLEVFTPTWSLGVGRSGGFGGVVAGYNYQIDKFVLGVQGEYNFSSINGSASARSGAQNFTVDSKVNSFGSIDGRIGFTPFDRVLVYGIGGFAFGHLQHSVTFSTPIVETDSFSANQTGYDWGGGVEYAVQKNWSVRAEYRHYNFGHKDFAAAGLVGAQSTNETLSSVRLGVVYLFGG